MAVGYGTQKKVNLTGAVSQINAEDLKDRPLTNMTQALQGEIPNLNIVIGSGKPGTTVMRDLLRRWIIKQRLFVRHFVTPLMECVEAFHNKGIRRPQPLKS